MIIGGRDRIFHNVHFGNRDTEVLVNDRKKERYSWTKKRCTNGLLRVRCQ